MILFIQWIHPPFNLQFPPKELCLCLKILYLKSDNTLAPQKHAQNISDGLTFPEYHQ